jgi:hypothetical protein
MGALGAASLLSLSLAAAAQDSADDQMAPAYFTLVEETMDGFVTTDPRFSGTWLANDPVQYPVALLHGSENVYSGRVSLANDDGRWVGWTSGFSWGDDVPCSEQMWLAGEGAYEDLAAVAVIRCGMSDMTLDGVIFHVGDVPALWEPPAE